jgi:hypothetical protein
VLQRSALKDDLEILREACPACHAEASEGGSEAEGLRMTFTRRVTGNSVKTVEAIKPGWKWGTWEESREPPSPSTFVEDYGATSIPLPDRGEAEGRRRCEGKVSDP